MDLPCPLSSPVQQGGGRPAPPHIQRIAARGPPPARCRCRRRSQPQFCHSLLASRRSWILLLARPFLAERLFAFRNVGAIAVRVDERIGTAAFHFLVLGLETEIGAVRPQKQ